MKPFSAKFFRDSVTLYPVVETEGATGTPKVGCGDPIGPLSCRAEYLSGSSDNSRRAAWQDAAESRTGWTLYFQANPACKALDKFVLTDGDGTRDLIALGLPRRDASGSGVLFAVDCEERS